MGNLFILGADGMTDISVSTGDTKNDLQPGRVLQINANDNPRYVIVKNQGVNPSFPQHGARYLCVNLTNYAFKTSAAYTLKHAAEKKDNRIQTYITDETMGEIETAEIWEKAETTKKELQQQEEIAAAAHKKTLADLPGQFPHLHTRTDKPKLADQALAAKNLKIELGRTFPRVKFSVTSSSFSMGDSVDVRWTDGPTSDQVTAIADRYQEGSFDGMNDLYTYNTNAFHEVFGGSKYVMSQRDCSNLPYETAAADLGFSDKITFNQYGTIEGLDHADSDDVKRAARKIPFDADGRRLDRDHAGDAEQMTTTDTAAPIDTDPAAISRPISPGVDIASNPAQATDTDQPTGGVSFGEYKNHPTITLPHGRKGFTFGLAKARAILAHIEDIKTFAASA